MFLQPEEVLERVALKTGQTVADLGAGAGFLTLPAAVRVGPEGLVYAVDVSKDNLAAIKSQAKLFGLGNIATVWADLEVPGSTKTKITDHSVDVTFIFKVLCLQVGREAILREAQRMTKPGGRVVIAEWCEYPGSPLGFGPSGKKLLTKRQLAALLNEVGFVIQQEHKLDDFHYVLEVTPQ